MKFMKFGKTLWMSALSVATILGVSSCVQSYTVGYLYVTGTSTSDTTGNGIISGFKIDHNTGQLRNINGFPVSTAGSNPIRAVLIQAGKFMYVLNRGTTASGGANCTTTDPCQGSSIVQFVLGGNGILTQQQIFYSQGINPFRMVSDSAGNFIYVLDHDAPDTAYCSHVGTATCGDVTVFQVDPTTGRLSLVVNAQVTSNTGASLTYFPVPANPIDFTLTSSNFLLTLSGTPQTGDSIFPYSRSASNGQLTVNQNSAQPLNVNQATALVYSSFLYVLDNEPITYTPVGSSSPITSPSQILPFTVGTNGSLQAQTGGAVPDDPSLSNPVYLLAESKGKWVYVINAGDNSNTNNPQSGIAGYTVQTDTSSKQLTTMSGSPFGTGAGPQCIVEDPSNQFVYTANFNDSTVTGRLIDQNIGKLDELPGKANQKYPVEGPPTWCLVSSRTN